MLIGIARLPKEDCDPDDDNTCLHPDGDDADSLDTPDMDPEDLDTEDPIDEQGDDE